MLWLAGAVGADHSGGTAPGLAFASPVFPQCVAAHRVMAVRKPGRGQRVLFRRSGKMSFVTNGDDLTITVVGIGEDGWAGLTEPARAALLEADAVLGGDRQIDLVREHVRSVEAWPHDLVDAVSRLPQTHAGRRVAVLGSGDPLLHGVGGTLLRTLGPSRVTVLPHPSSVSLACARLGWPLDRVTVMRSASDSMDGLRPLLHPGARVLVLGSGADTARQVARCLEEEGYGRHITVLERLGGARERIVRADGGGTGMQQHDELAVVAVECTAEPPARLLSRSPGLPDDAYVTDGQLTKREIRAVTLASLVPVPEQLLWDVGAGSGSVAIEWMRTDSSCRAVAIETLADRCDLIRANQARLGVPDLRVVHGAAPEALAGLPAPDAVFVGGAVTVPGVMEACVAALPVGGRLVVNAVTVEAETAVFDWSKRLGGLVRRLDVSRLEPLGSFRSLRPGRPVTQWVHIREANS